MPPVVAFVVPDEIELESSVLMVSLPASWVGFFDIEDERFEFDGEGFDRLGIESVTSVILGKRLDGGPIGFVEGLTFDKSDPALFGDGTDSVTSRVEQNA